MATRHYSHNSRRRSHHKRNTGRFYFLVLLFGGLLLLYTQKDQILAFGSGFNPETIPQTTSVLGDYWWNPDFAYRRELEIAADTKQVVVYEFDHAGMVGTDKSHATGSDLQVVAQIGENTDEVGFSLVGAGSTSAKVAFDTGKYPTANYYLYYGNKSRTVPAQILGAMDYSKASEISGSGEQAPLLSIRADQFWQLRYKDGIKLALNLESTLPAADSVYSGRLIVISQDNAIEMKLKQGEQIIDLSYLPEGIQKLYFVTTVDGTVYRSNNIQLNVSAPMFVAWSIDWEGRDVQDWFLNAIDSIARKYSMPLTQFFNPRIYIAKDIPEYRANELTSWVKSRQLSQGDEIALHMHMYYDMVKAAGVEPSLAPRWGSGLDGYDILTSNYSYGDFSKILEWGLATFAKKGLPKPEGYRAGGWFADNEILNALNDFGFTYDSSGRESYAFGSQEKEGFWKLTSATQPYRPSKNDQNSDQAPQLNLWEVPNNGNDSYWFTKEKMLENFHANYKPGQVLGSPTIVTYLSHPDWFDVDQPKLEALFAEIDQYSYKADRGPVVYSTISNALTQWQD